MRYLLLLALALVPGCGRSSLGSRGDAGRAEAIEASADRHESPAEADSGCRYHATEDYYVVSCNGRFQFITEMYARAQADCPRYFVYPGTSRIFDRSENDCAPCTWEASEWTVSDRCGSTNIITEYASHFLECPPIAIWVSSVTGDFYTSRDEARATLPVCADSGT